MNKVKIDPSTNGSAFEKMVEDTKAVKRAQQMDRAPEGPRGKERPDSPPNSFKKP
jgi:hypothetical protein